MPPRQYKCTACGHRHIKPINDKCPFVDINQQDDADSDIPCGQPQNDDRSTTSSDSSSVSDVPVKMGEQILDKLIAIEGRVASMQHQIQSNSTRIDDMATSRSVTPTARADVIPSMSTLQTDHIQQQVDARLRQIGQLGEDDLTGRYKSQRGGV